MLAPLQLPSPASGGEVKGEESQAELLPHPLPTEGLGTGLEAACAVTDSERGQPREGTCCQRASPSLHGQPAWFVHDDVGGVGTALFLRCARPGTPFQGTHSSALPWSSQKFLF